jgi:mRNA interferase RelE/StbE
MKYTVRLNARVGKVLNRLPPDMRRRLVRRLAALEDNPRPRGVEKLAGVEELYRVRVGTYRIVYAIRDRELVVVIVRVGHRRDVYR